MVFTYSCILPKSLNLIKEQGAVSIRKTVLPGMAIPMLKIRRPNAVLSLTWKSPYVDKTVFILRRGPGGLSVNTMGSL